MSKKVLIVGSQGYLGSRLTEHLKNFGYDCYGIDTGFFKNGILTSPDLIPTITKDARFITKSDLEGYDSLILLAGISNDPFGNMSAEQIYNPARDYALNIASMCKEMGIKFIFPSSCSVYGAASDGFLTEESQTNPQTPYSINKLQVEKGLSLLSDKNFSPIALRFGTVYGMSPRMRFDVVINMLCGMALVTKKVILNSDGQAWRPHLHIHDACDSFRCCLDWELDTDELTVLNVGRNEDNYKIIDVAKTINANVDGSELSYLDIKSDNKDFDLIKDKKIQDGVDTRTYKVLFDKVNEILPGFKCQWNIEKGIKNLLEELKKINLNKDVFNQRDFYRLQQIEFLHKSKQIDDNLIWNKNA